MLECTFAASLLELLQNFFPTNMKCKRLEFVRRLPLDKSHITAHIDGWLYYAFHVKP